MLTLRADTRNRNAKAFENIKARIAKSADKQYRQKVLYMFKDAASVSAQFSGDFVSNWRLITQGGELGVYKMWPGKNPQGLSGLDLGMARAHQAGDSEAVDFAVTRAKFVKFGMKDKIYFVNSTPLAFTESTVTGPAGDEKSLRPVNIIPGGVRLASYLKSKYGSR